MKVQLIVVRGKPEGKVIPLAGPKFKIGRGETCHLRPNSEQVSREHAEFTIESSAVIVRDLGSRNGTLVNGKALTTAACKLKDRDLVQVGPLTFAVSILDAPKAAAKAATPPTASPAAAAEVAQAKAKPSPDEVPAEDIDSWLCGDSATATADRPTTAVYGGDTITIAAFKDSQIPLPQPDKLPSVADDAEYERQTEEEELETQDDQAGAEETSDEEAEDDEAAAEQKLEEELMDPSNPFYVAKQAQKEQSKTGAAGAGAHKQGFKDSSDAANDILRKLMERRRASRS